MNNKHSAGAGSAGNQSLLHIISPIFSITVTQEHRADVLDP